jgi:hypothetical protein
LHESWFAAHTDVPLQSPLSEPSATSAARAGKMLAASSTTSAP